MAAIVEILRSTPEGMQVRREVYHQGGAQIYKGQMRSIVVRGDLASAEVWQNRIPQTLRPGDDPIEIKLADGSTLRVTAADLYQPTD